MISSGCSALHSRPSLVPALVHAETRDSMASPFTPPAVTRIWRAQDILRISSLPASCNNNRRKSFCPTNSETCVSSPAGTRAPSRQHDSSSQRNLPVNGISLRSTAPLESRSSEWYFADVDKTEDVASYPSSDWIHLPQPQQCVDLCSDTRSYSSPDCNGESGPECSQSQHTPTSANSLKQDKKIASKSRNASRRTAMGFFSAFFAAMLSWQYHSMPAGAFSILGNTNADKDPIEPFTIYGSLYKKYLIEVTDDGGHIIGRKKGFTASVCVNTLEASKETPQLQSIPTGLKVNLIGEPICAKGEGSSREASCEKPCQRACSAQVTRHAAEIRESGYLMESKDQAKVEATCVKQCFYECTKAGKSGSFVLPFRL